MPLGRAIWTINDQSTELICEENPGTEMQLTFTSCTDDQFTCDNGHCVQLESRCNNKPDCLDLSDELQCSYVSISGTYVQQLIPPPDEKGLGGRIVYINITIKSFPNIDSTNLQFTADFYLFLRWFDPRLTFKNIVSRN